MIGINAYTVFLSHYNLNTKNIITDETPSNYGDPSISNTVYKFDSGALELETADHLIYSDSDNYDFGTDNFTIDCWIYPTSFAIDYQGIVSTVGAYAWDWGDTAWMLCMRSSGAVELRGSASGGKAIVTSGSLTVTLNQWNHIAVVRKGTSSTDLNISINGTFGDSPVSGNVAILSGNALNVGVINGNTPTSNYFTGYIDELRIQNGEASWTSNFTPETEAYNDGSITTTFDLDFRTRLLVTTQLDFDLRFQAPIQYLTFNQDFRTRLLVTSLLNTDFRTRIGLRFNTDFRTKFNDYLIFDTDFRTGKLPTTIPTGYDSWTEYATDLGYTDAQEYYTEQGYNDLKALPQSSITLYINGVLNTEVDISSINVNLTVDQEPTASFSLPRYIDKPSYNLSNTLSDLQHHNIVEIFYDTKRIFIGRVTNISGNIDDNGLIQVTAKATINSHFCPHYTKTITNTDGTTKTETIFLSSGRLLNLPSSSIKSSIYDIQNVSLDWQNEILTDLSTDTDTKTAYSESTEYQNSNIKETDTVKKISEEEANGIEVDLGYASFDGISSGYFQITTFEELFNFKPLKNKEYFFVLENYVTTSSQTTTSPNYLDDSQYTFANGDIKNFTTVGAANAYASANSTTITDIQGLINPDEPTISETVTNYTTNTSFSDTYESVTTTTTLPCYLGNSSKEVLDAEPLLLASSFLITIYWNRKDDYKVQVSKEDIDAGLYENANISSEQDENDISSDWDSSFTDYYLVNQIKLGSYLIGSAPYYKISCDNGSFSTCPVYELGNNFLLAKIDETYDYITYAQQYAQASYWKLPQIQSKITVTTSHNPDEQVTEETINQTTSETYNKGTLNITLTFDAWKFYNICLNNKINISNTKQTNEWINRWGFPFNVNSITFNAGNMSVVLGLTSKVSSVVTKPAIKNYFYTDSRITVPQAQIKWTTGLLSQKEGDNIVNPLVSTQTSLPNIIISSDYTDNEQDTNLIPTKPTPTPIKKKKIAVIYKSAKDIYSELMEKNRERIDKYGIIIGGNKEQVFSEFLNTQADT